MHRDPYKSYLWIRLTRGRRSRSRSEWFNIAQFDLKGIKLGDFGYEGLQFLDAQAGKIFDTGRPGGLFPEQ
jgi:hypothetical protein